MGAIQVALGSTIAKISDQNYDESIAFYRFWFEIAQTYSGILPNQIFNDICGNRGSTVVDGTCGKLIHPTAHLILRFASDAESDSILGPHCVGLQSRICTTVLGGFFENNMRVLRQREGGDTEGVGYWFPAEVNFIAHWANLGYVKEATIRNHILQSLISHSKLYEHQADALIVLFKLAGATFAKYADPAVVDRCFELLKVHYGGNSVRSKLVREVIELRERGWEGIPPPPVLKPKSTGTNPTDPAATPVVTSLGLPNADTEPQIPQPPPPEPATVPEPETDPATPAIQSPSISIVTLSDFAIADTSDDESPVDSTTVTPHDTFYLEGGDAEVLCGNTLFRVHTGIFSFHSPALRQMFTQTNLASAESPNGCPRILSSDTATDFATLLKTIYLPGFPEKNKVPDFVTFSSLLRITAKYELPAVRSQLLEVVRDGYPETFEGLVPSKPLGERIFSGRTPHPNEVLNLFVQQNLTSALPMAYYMAARRGLRSLMDTHRPAGARLPPEILRAAVEGLIALREMELKESHRLILGSSNSRTCFSPNCTSPKTMDPRGSDVRHEIVDRIVGSSQSGTKILQVLSLSDVCGGDNHGFCESCVEWWECGRAEVRKKAWDGLPGVFGLSRA